MKKITLLVTLINLLACSDYADYRANELNSWKKNTAVFSIDSITAFVEKVCDKNDSEFFVKCEDRIAVFDMDGTIACEKPVSMETLCWYNLAFPEDTIIEIKDEMVRTSQNHSFTLKKLSDTIQYQIKKGELKINSDTLIQSYYNKITSIYNQSIPQILPQKRILKNQFYNPMLQLISYLQENQFRVYIVSGSTEQFIEAAIRSNTNIKLDRTNIIGSMHDFNLIYTENNGTSFLVNEALIVSNISKYKAINIHHRIGKTPILAFGNTVHDLDMFALTSSNKKYQTMCVLVNHDSNEYEEKYLPYSANSTINRDWSGSLDTSKWTPEKFDSTLKVHKWRIMNISEVFIKDSIFSE